MSLRIARLIAEMVDVSPSVKIETTEGSKSMNQVELIALDSGGSLSDCTSLALCGLCVEPVARRFSQAASAASPVRSIGQAYGAVYAKTGQGRVQSQPGSLWPLVKLEQILPGAQSDEVSQAPTPKFGSRQMAGPPSREASQMQFVQACEHDSSFDGLQAIKQPPFRQISPAAQFAFVVHSATPGVIPWHVLG